MKYLEQKALRGGYPNKALPGPDEDKSQAGTDALEGVRFGSPSAKKQAEEAGLTAESFKRRRTSSERGFTLADVERIAASAGTEDEGA